MTKRDIWSSEFAVTCVTSGGPATCVQSEKDGSPIANFNSVTTLIDPGNSIYHHVLTVSEPDGTGDYGCTVFNDKPDNVSGNLQVKRKFFFTV